MTRNERGFTLIELMVVVTVLSLLAGLAMPKYQQIRKRATAAQAIGALGVIRHAAFAYNETTGTWAPGGNSGEAPAELTTYLPAGFSFAQQDFDLAWRHSSWLNGSVEESAQMVQVFTRDLFVCDAVYHLLGGADNKDLVAACDGAVGMVTLYVES
jgi:prepilin-type N-terminal cleavage/methylation domain-containing protein